MLPPIPAHEAEPRHRQEGLGAFGGPTMDQRGM
ncbi:TPA: hypothetical protein N0F65_005598 [Lagenidium giganteum]|uniref:Uncharacterized protein n=1 Tax=Lagenidium giganteum TaxID=4803 RepID=A0AAV2Z5W1_9STRA|nr:TPA: hypothetical protein N0F65_005598 [Lagenidium giganteum]